MKDINLIDSCQAHLPVQYPSNIKFIRQKWLTAGHTWVAHAKQASCLLHWLSMFTLADPHFCFTLKKALIRLHIKLEILCMKLFAPNHKLVYLTILYPARGWPNLKPLATIILRYLDCKFSMPYKFAKGNNLKKNKPFFFHQIRYQGG